MDPDSKDRGAGDLWELTIDDLFSTSDAAASELGTAVPGPYTIDLCESVEPASEIASCLRDFDQLQVYQVTDWKEDQLVFRLRLGPIDSELEADAILSIVRRDYPDATTLPMGDDDLRVIAIASGSAASRTPVAQAAAAQPIAQPVTQFRKPETTEPTKNTEKAEKVAVARAATATPAPVAKPASPTPAEATPVEAPLDPAATLPSTTADGGPTDFAAAFRDLAAELLALDPTPALPAAKPANDAVAAVPPPVLTAAIQGKRAPAPATDRASDSPARAPAEAPPVLNIDAVARPPRERAERRAGQDLPASATRAPAAVTSPTPATDAPARGAEPAVAARTAPPPVAAATSGPPVDHAAPPSTHAVACAAKAEARPVEPHRAPQPASRPMVDAAPRSVPGGRAASVPPPRFAPSVLGAAQRDSRPPDPPRVPLRGMPASAAPVAGPATAPNASTPTPPASAPPATVLSLAPETPVMTPIAASARIPTPPAEFDLELELLPDDLATPTPGTPSGPAVRTARFEAFAASTVTLELVVDEPRTPPAALPEPAPPQAISPSPQPASARPAAARTPAPVATTASKAPPQRSPPAASTAPARAIAAPQRAAAPAPPARATAAVTAPRTPPPGAATATPPKAAAVAAPTATPSKKPSSGSPAPVAVPRQAAAAPQTVAAAAAPAPVAAQKAPPAAAEQRPAPQIDSTQTLRALVVPKDPAAPTEKLIVIQLVLSEREIAPESVPDLAIFKEYRLYSAVGHHEGRVMHALRLGFFSDEGPAEMVAGYLRSYFDAPVVTRISVEERERFAARRIAARKEGADTGVHTAIELASAPSAPSISLADLSARAQAEPAAKPGNGRPGARSLSE